MVATGAVAAAHVEGGRRAVLCAADNDWLDRPFCACLPQHAQHKSVRLTAPTGECSHPGNRTVRIQGGAPQRPQRSRLPRPRGAPRQSLQLLLKSGSRTCMQRAVEQFSVPKTASPALSAGRPAQSRARWHACSTRWRAQLTWWPFSWHPLDHEVDQLTWWRFSRHPLRLSGTRPRAQLTWWRLSWHSLRLSGTISQARWQRRCRENCDMMMCRVGWAGG